MVISNNASILSPKVLENGNFIEKDYYEKNAFLDSFVYDNDFEGKKFTRFMQKTEAALYQFMIKKIKVPDIDQFTNIYSMLKDCICTYMWNIHDTVEPVKKGSFLKIFWAYAFPLSDICVLPEEVMEEIALGKEDIQGYELPVTEIIMKELRESCKYHILLQSVSGKITKDNYMLCVPKTAKDCMFLIQMCLNRSLVDIERCLCSYLSTFSRDIARNDTIQKNQSTIQNLESEITKLKEQIEFKNAQIHKLKKQKDDLENKNVSSDFQKEYNALYHEKETIAKKYAQIEEKYQKLKDEVSDHQEDVILNETQKRKLNKNLRYLFIVNSDIYLAKVIQNNFPNSTLKTKNITSQLIQGMDAVIFITANIKHTDYYKTRNLCKNLNVPYVHSCKLNMDQIITDMEKALKKDKFFSDVA